MGYRNSLLRIDRLSKHFGGLQALTDVSFELPEGHILGLIGPNGAGKTTLFNVINGVYLPEAGRVFFQGKDITSLPSYKIAQLGLARTHQVVRPLNELSVRENVMVGACFGREGHTRAAAARVAEEVLARLGMADRALQLASSLNVAQKKRLELARALASRPYLLLLDEVLAGLNPAEITLMLDTIRRIRDEGVTILMIEHVMQAVMAISDRILVLDYGALIAEGTPQEVADNPRVIEAYLGDPKLAQKLLAADREEVNGTPSGA
ncbi:MAG: ABC transporter ATP-binding protein [Thermoflexales bacterium]|nr:ABC transporter ATP-binding protein [Thermoflexales bacterium]